MINRELTYQRETEVRMILFADCVVLCMVCRPDFGAGDKLPKKFPEY